MPITLQRDLPASRQVAMRWRFGGLLLAGLTASALASGLNWPADLRDMQRWLLLLLPLNQTAWALATILALSVAGSLLGLPVTVMIALSAMLFGAVPGLLYSLAGCMAGAMLAYAVGYRLAPDGRLRTAQPLHRLHAKLEQGGLLTIVLLRLFPLLPFTLVNLAAGAMRVRWRDYVVGTALGMLPSIVLLSLILGRLRPADPTLTSRHIDTAFIALLCVLLAAWISPWLARRYTGVAQGDTFSLREPIPHTSTPSVRRQHHA